MQSTNSSWSVRSTLAVSRLRLCDEKRNHWLHGRNFNRILLFGKWRCLAASPEYHIEIPVDAWVGKVKKQHETLEFNFLKANIRSIKQENLPSWQQTDEPGDCAESRNNRLPLSTSTLQTQLTTVRLRLFIFFFIFTVLGTSVFRVQLFTKFLVLFLVYFPVL